MSERVVEGLNRLLCWIGLHEWWHHDYRSTVNGKTVEHRTFRRCLRCGLSLLAPEVPE